jgi:cytochrome c oxidase subunit 2
MFNNFPLWPERASSVAGNVDALFIFLLIVSGLMTLLIFACVVYFAARYRYRPGVLAEQIEGSLPLELTWSIIPLFVFVVIFLSWPSNGCGSWNMRKANGKSTNCMFRWDAM